MRLFRPPEFVEISRAQQVMKNSPGLACGNCTQLARSVERFFMPTQMKENMPLVEIHVLEHWITRAEFQCHLDMGQRFTLHAKPIIGMRQFQTNAGIVRIKKHRTLKIGYCRFGLTGEPIDIPQGCVCLCVLIVQFNGTFGSLCRGHQCVLRSIAPLKEEYGTKCSRLQTMRCRKFRIAGKRLFIVSELDRP